MDLSIDPPALAEPPSAVEPQAYIAHAANPTPPHPTNGNHNHPPYAEMIAAAITALKERNGSSRQAIAKYIERAYLNLPSNHSALLTHHLKRLKNTGQLAMVKHSYKLARSVPLSPIPGTGNGNALSSGTRRGPGRPPKPKVEAQPSNVVAGPESVLVSLGLVDGTAPLVKRRPGRPPKAKTVSVMTDLGGPVEVKRSRGRPRRPKLLPVLMSPSGPKKGRGRPPRIGPIGTMGAPPRPRGQPMKGPGRPRGRPPKNSVAVAAAGVAEVGMAAGGGGVLLGKRRGRPPRAIGVKKPRKLSGRPVGRPRKNASNSGSQSAGTQQLAAYDDLKYKFEYFQSRVKQAVSIVMPHLNDTAATAFGALQELDELAKMDLRAPLVQIQDPIPVQVQEPFLPS